MISYLKSTIAKKLGMVVVVGIAVAAAGVYLKGLKENKATKPHGYLTKQQNAQWGKV